MSDEPYCVGVLCQDLSISFKEKFQDTNYTSALPASYVKFVKDSGGECIPIALNKNDEYYNNICEIVDGILLPGGGFSLEDSKGYTPSGKLLLDAVKYSAENGRDIPVFGICLGFELMAVYFAAESDILPFEVLSNCVICNMWKSLTFTEEVASSRLIPTEGLKKLPANNVSYFYHRKCVTLDDFNKRLGDEWRALAVAERVKREGSGDKITVITCMESKTKPYFGVQFHPEKKHESQHRERCTDIDAAEIASQVFSGIFKTMMRKRRKDSHKPAALLIDNFSKIDVRDDEKIKHDFLYMFKDDELK